MFTLSIFNRSFLIINLQKMFIHSRFLFGLLFIFSGLIKIYNLSDFQTAVKSFELLPVDFIEVFSYVVPLAELLLGSFIICGFQSILSIQFSIYLLTIFTAIVIVKIYEGVNISCGCFGALSSNRIDEFTVARNILLILWGMTIIFFIIKKNSSNNFNQIKSKISAVISIAVFTFLFTQNATLALMNMNLKDQISILLQKDKLKEGEFVDPVLTYSSEGLIRELNFQNYDKTVLFIMKYGCELCENNIPNWNKIFKYSRNNQIRVIGIAFNSVEYEKKLKQENDLHFELGTNFTKEFKRNYKLILTPITLIINRFGKVEKIFEGSINENTTQNILQFLNKKL
jgi:peroxiredoxin/uncharacterized membrane protein YphA (DoxX/SURF4 family)